MIRADTLNLVVKAIVADAPANSSFQFTSFIPLSNLLLDKDRRENDEQWGNANYITFIKIRPQTNIAAVTKKITNVLQQRSGDTQGISGYIVLHTE